MFRVNSGVGKYVGDASDLQMNTRKFDFAEKSSRFIEVNRRTVLTGYRRWPLEPSDLQETMASADYQERGGVGNNTASRYCPPAPARRCVRSAAEYPATTAQRVSKCPQHQHANHNRLYLVDKGPQSCRRVHGQRRRHECLRSGCCESRQIKTTESARRQCAELYLPTAHVAATLESRSPKPSAAVIACGNMIASGNTVAAASLRLGRRHLSRTMYTSHVTRHSVTRHTSPNRIEFTEYDNTKSVQEKPTPNP